jgi:hypothetical protein
MKNEISGAAGHRSQESGQEDHDHQLNDHARETQDSPGHFASVFFWPTQPLL